MNAMSASVRLRHLSGDERGSILVLAALAATILIGFVGLATDVAMLYAQRQALQNAADAAALGAAATYVAGNTAGYAAEGQGDAAASLANGQGNASVVISMPPTQGAYKGVAGYVEAKVSQPVATVFMGPLFQLVQGTAANQTVTVTATAVASTTGTANTVEDCMLALDNVIVDGGAQITLPSCGMAANSTGSQAVLFNSGAHYSGTDVTTPGDIVQNNGSHVDGDLYPGSSPATDPYNGLSYILPGNCAGFPNSGSPTGPGCYNNVNLGGTVTFPAGTYYIQGDMNFNSGARVSGTGVTFVLLGNLNIGDGVQVNFSAPTADAFSGVATAYNYAGVVFFKPGSGNVNINSGSQSSIDGAVYAPQAAVDFDDGSSVAQCNQVVGYSLTFNSGGKYDHTCNNVAIRKITDPNGPGTVALVQ